MTTMTVKGKVAEILQKASTELGDKADELIYDAISNLLRTESLPSSHREETESQRAVRRMKEKGLIGFLKIDKPTEEYVRELREERFRGE